MHDFSTTPLDGQTDVSNKQNEKQQQMIILYIKNEKKVDNRKKSHLKCEVKTKIYGF